MTLEIDLNLNEYEHDYLFRTEDDLTTRFFILLAKHNPDDYLSKELIIAFRPMERKNYLFDAFLSQTNHVCVLVTKRNGECPDNIVGTVVIGKSECNID